MEKRESPHKRFNMKSFKDYEVDGQRNVDDAV